ncbi:MAG: hypothetical protein ACPL3E_01690, partial [Minisyncoccia bacterium]
MPYLNVIVFSFILWLIFEPLFNKILYLFKNKSLSAVITVFLIFLFIFLPLVFIGFQFFNEIKNYLNNFNNEQVVNLNLNLGGFKYLKNLLNQFNVDLQNFINS